MKKRIVIIVLLVVVICSLAYILLSTDKKTSTTKTTASISINKIDARYSITSDKDGFVGTFYGESNTINLSLGKHSITISSDDYEDYVAQVDIKEKDQAIKIEMQKKNAKTSALELIGGKGTKIIKAEYFAGSTWVVAFVQQDGSYAEADIIIAKKVGETWKPVSQGSVIDTDYLRLEGAPSDLILYAGKL